MGRNFKTRMCEIDVVSEKDGVVFFTEVKTRRDGSGLLAVDEAKLARMKFAVEVFLKKYERYREHDLRLAVASVGGDFEVRDFIVI